MSIDIRDIPGQYFYVWDKEREEAASIVLQKIWALAQKDEESQREELRELLHPVIGFRQADKLWQGDLGELEEIVSGKLSEQQELHVYLNRLFEAKILEAAKRHPEDFGQKEMLRDAAFYPLARTGLIVLTDSLVGKTDWEQIAGELSSGKRLEDYLPEELVDVATDLFPKALMFNQYRAELKEKLRGYIGEEEARKIDQKLPDAIDLNGIEIGEEQKRQIEEMLMRCALYQADFQLEFEKASTRLNIPPEQKKQLEKKLKKVVKGSSFLLARSLAGLKRGVVYEDVSSNFYRQIDRYAIGQELSELGLKESSIEHVHTKNARYVSYIKSLLEAKGLSTCLINYLRTDIVSNWHSNCGNGILDPKQVINSEIIGKYIGYFLFGHGSESKSASVYCDSKKERVWFLNLLEEAGILINDPAMNIGSPRSKSIDAKRYDIPVQFLDLSIYGLNLFKMYPNQEVARAALKSWLDDRGGNQHRSGCHALIKKEYEHDIKQMAQIVGLNISNGHEHSNRSKTVFINNPEVIGYHPKQ